MKNFVKLIKQVHAEKFSFVLKKILSKKIPVAFISAASISQAVETTKTFRAQGLNVTTLFVVDRAPAPACLAFDIIHVKDAANFFPQPEYIFANDLTAAGVALEKFPASKLLFVGNNTDEIYETFMAHLDDLQEVYESLLDEESKKVFRGYWLGNISNRLDKIVYSNTPHYICAGFLPERGAIVIDGGLCDGGTALRFSQMGYEVYGFEMDRENYEVARKVGEENNFVVENFGARLFQAPNDLHAHAKPRRKSLGFKRTAHGDNHDARQLRSRKKFAARRFYKNGRGRRGTRRPAWCRDDARALQTDSRAQCLSQMG